MTNQGLYKGTGDLGSAVKRMQVTGKRIISEERNRLIHNRYMYLGDQYVTVTPTGVRHLPDRGLRNGKQRFRINRLRQFVDGRVALLSREVPPFEVTGTDLDTDTISSARVAEKLVRYQWGDKNGWDINTLRRRVCLMGEQDGVVFGNVRFNPEGGDQSPQPIPFRPDGTPITDRAELEALRQQDPNGEVLWTMRPMKVGKVETRAVRVGAMSVDPLVTNDWGRCRWVIESDVWSVEQVEAYAGRSLPEIREKAKEVRGGNHVAGATTGAGVDRGDGRRPATAPGSVVIHEAWIVPHGDWPKGGHIVIVDDSPEDPILVEPYDRGSVPYFPYTPKPDEIEILRSRGTVDELAPVQTIFSRTLSAIGEWLNHVATPTLLLDGGSVRSQDPIFNERGVTEVNAGMTPPQFLRVPGEPVAILNNYLAFLTQQMAELSVQHDASRGTTPGSGVDTGVALDLLDRNNERQLAGTEAELTRFLEWVVCECLYLTSRYYSIPRLIDTPGVDTAPEFQAFKGDMIRGATRYRITGSVLPRNRETQMQMLLNVAAQSNGEVAISKWLPELVKGDADAITARLADDENRQKTETNMILALGRHAQRDEIWAEFVEQRDMFMQALQSAMQDGEPDPQAVLAAHGIHHPTVKGLLRAAREAYQVDAQREPMAVPGLPQQNTTPPPPVFPEVEDSDEDDVHIRTLGPVFKGDGWYSYHPLVQQALREHRQEHLEKQQRQLQGMSALLGGGGQGAGEAGSQPGSAEQEEVTPA